jgi:hypothetical protein
VIDSLIVGSYKVIGALPMLPMDKDDKKKPNDGSGSVTVIDPKNFQKPKGLEDKLGQIISVGAWIVLALCVAGVLMCAAQMAIARKNGAESAVVGLVWALAACVIAGSASAIVGIVA